MNKPKTVSAYIAAAPKESRFMLRQMRSIIRAAAPEAEECISYGMPYYHYLGRLAYFAGYKHHVGLYLPPPIIQQYKKDLAKYETSRGTVRFPLDRKISASLVRKLIRARLKINKEKAAKK
jgi:uncharacterized protein YdhG (YjbR/CyaY superfamily)